jgi:Nucleotidyl transferase AbiEii toxin, Type IV TA system
MFSADQLNAKIRKAATSLGIQDVNRVRGILTLERIVARLMTNPFLREHLVFGGGFVLFKELSTYRYTRDADAVISGINPENLIKEVNQSLSQDSDDGFWFGDVLIEDLETESGYGGIRFKILYKVGYPIPTEKEKSKLRRIHLDISIGVDLEDVAKEAHTSSIIQTLDAIEWKIYPPEFIASEKIHCLLFRGDMNTRGKDVYDLPLIFRETSDIDLLNAIDRTFSRRSFKVDSLYEASAILKTEILKTHYNSVLVERMENSFEESWSKILEKLKTLDTLRGKP